VSVSSINPSTACTVASPPRPGPYEINSKAFGPVAASAIGVAQAIGDAASSVCSFSSEGLDALGDAAKAVYDGAASAVHQVEDIAGSIVGGVESAAGTVAGYVALGVAAGEKLIDEVA